MSRAVVLMLCYAMQAHEMDGSGVGAGVPRSVMEVKFRLETIMTDRDVIAEPTSRKSLVPAIA